MPEPMHTVAAPAGATVVDDAAVAIDCPAIASYAAIEAVAAALEALAFTSISALVPADAEPPADALAVEMTIAGDRAVGRLSLLAPRALARHLAETIFSGEGPGPIADEQAEDALREIANIACGAAAGQLGASVQGQMSLPQLRRIDDAEWRAAAHSEATSVVDVEGHTLVICLRFGAGPSAERGNAREGGDAHAR